MSDPLMVLHKVYAPARDPMPADKSALGYMPISAFQYCEAMRTASGYGWYVFPPDDIQLIFDGYQPHVAEAGQWRPLRHKAFDQEYLAHWDAICPEDLRGRSPNFLTALSDPGVVQVWTGFFVSTAPGYALSIRPLVNIHPRKDFFAFEAIVETDDFAPCPLFINIQLKTTDREITIRKEFPLFQIQPVLKAAYKSATPDSARIDTVGAEGFDWDGIKSTLRIPGVSETRKSPGQYAARVRRQDKRDRQE